MDYINYRKLIMNYDIIKDIVYEESTFLGGMSIGRYYCPSRLIGFKLVF